MRDWQLWLSLAAMLSLGGLFRVGVFLPCFAGAALITASLGAIMGLSLEGQLQVFLMISGLSMLIIRYQRKQKALNRS